MKKEVEDLFEERAALGTGRKERVSGPGGQSVLGADLDLGDDGDRDERWVEYQDDPGEKELEHAPVEFEEFEAPEAEPDFEEDDDLSPFERGAPWDSGLGSGRSDGMPKERMADRAPNTIVKRRPRATQGLRDHAGDQPLGPASGVLPRDAEGGDSTKIDAGCEECRNRPEADVSPPQEGKKCRRKS